MKRYFSIWWTLSVASIQTSAASKATIIFFIFGKLLRFGLFLGFILLLHGKTRAMGGYTLWAVILFFTTFNFVDTASQLFFREVYRFRPNMMQGTFDFYLLKPFSPLFRCLLGGMDILDVPLLLISFLSIVFAGYMVGHTTVIQSVLFLLLLINALVLAAAFHIFILCIGILSTTVDQLLWVYRDITIFGRVPITVYQEPIRSFMTFVIPVGIMIAFPAQALLGMLTPFTIFLAFFIGIVLFLGSLRLWQYSLKQYTSVSS